MGHSLRAICRDAGMPPPSTVRWWVVDDRNGFAARYARARDVGLDDLAEEIIDISDDAGNDWMESNDPDNPGWRANHDHIQRSKLRVDARKWYVAKLAPKRYGDRLDVTSGGDKLAASADPTETASRVAALLERARARKDAPPDETPDDGSDLV